VRRVCLKGSRAAFAARFGVWPGSGRIKALCGNEGFSVEAMRLAMRSEAAIDTAATTIAAIHVAGLIVNGRILATRRI
jgi:hypothetical protein